MTTVRGSVSGTKKILGIVQRKDSIGTDEDNVKIGFGDESMDMTRNLIVEHKVNRSTVYEKMGFNVASSSKAITTMAAPCFFSNVACSLKSSSPTLREMEFTIGLP